MDKNLKMEIEKALERIELQLKAVWWDNLLYFLWMLIISLELVAMFTHNLILVMYGFVFFIILYPIIQLFEYIQLNKIRRYYKNGDK